MAEQIYILGSGGFAKEVAFLIDEINRKSHKWDILGYIDVSEKKGFANGRYNVVKTDDDLLNDFEPINLAIGIGNPEIVSKIIGKLKTNDNIHFPNIIHPNVVGDWKNIKLGKGNIICANNCFTTDINIGSFNIFNLGCTIGHDAEIGSFNVFNPSVNLSGGIQIDSLNLIGTGAQVLQYIKIKEKIIIGAGAVVSKSIEDQGTYVGIPAKKIK